MLETLTTLLQPWADRYADSPTLATALVSAHLLALFVSGGVAIGADRRVLRAAPSSAAAYRTEAEALHETHGLVIGMLALTILSGMALAAADLGTYAVSLVYWAKMAAFVALLANGLVMRRVEARLLAATGVPPVEASAAPPAEPSALWGGVRRTAGTSVTLWLLTVLLGVILSNG